MKFPWHDRELRVGVNLHRQFAGCRPQCRKPFSFDEAPDVMRDSMRLG